VEADLGHLDGLRPADDVSVQIADASLLEGQAAPFNRHPAVDQRLDTIEGIAGYGDRQSVLQLRCRSTGFFRRRCRAFATRTQCANRTRRHRRLFDEISS
jgi:hypothetical protein